MPRRQDHHLGRRRAIGAGADARGDRRRAVLDIRSHRLHGAPGDFVNAEPRPGTRHVGMHGIEFGEVGLLSRGTRTSGIEGTPEMGIDERPDRCD